MKHIGIFGGSFNPVHIGHTMLANFLGQFTDLDAVWMTLSPLNPLKQGSNELIADNDRLDMLKIAIAGCNYIETCDIELTMPRPSYTIDSLTLLQNRFPDYKFSIIIGSDNWINFSRWKDYDKIMDRFGIIVYPRPGYYITEPSDNPNVRFVKNAPIIEISSSFIRKSISEGKDMNYFLPPGVYKYITDHSLYKQTSKCQNN